MTPQRTSYEPGGHSRPTCTPDTQTVLEEPVTLRGALVAFTTALALVTLPMSLDWLLVALRAGGAPW